MRVFHVLATTVLFVTTAIATSASADSFDTVFCRSKSNADAIKTAIMSEPSLEFGANNESALATLNPLLASGECTTREFVDLSISDFDIHTDGLHVGIVAIDNGYAVAIDFPGT